MCNRRVNQPKHSMNGYAAIPTWIFNFYGKLVNILYMEQLGRVKSKLSNLSSGTFYLVELLAKNMQKKNMGQLVISFFQPILWLLEFQSRQVCKVHLWDFMVTTSWISIGPSCLLVGLFDIVVVYHFLKLTAKRTWKLMLGRLSPFLFEFRPICRVCQCVSFKFARFFCWGSIIVLSVQLSFIETF